jgi:hypothetical protein
MRNEHDDDMEPEVNEGAEGETQKYAVVAEDIDQRDAEAAEVDRMHEMRNNLEKAEAGEVDES